MRKAFLALLLTASICFGFDTLIEPKVRMTKNLFFVVDRSCSMQGDALDKAVTAVMDIAAQNTDEMNVACLAFGDTAIRWDGLPNTEPGGGPPPGWAAMPSANSAKELSIFLRGLSGQGGTNAAFALKCAMAATAPKNGPLTVIIVTDDILPNMASFDYSAGTKEFQKERVERKLGEAVLVGYRIGPGPVTQGENCLDASNLAKIVRVGPCGGMFQESE